MTLGLRSREQQRAWREKMGLVSIILVLMAGVGFLTFGFTDAVCGTPPDRFHGGAIGDSFIGRGSVTINGYDYDIAKFNHPSAGSTFNGRTNPLNAPGFANLAGNDASFLFQNTNGNCRGLITKASGSPITGQGSDLDWYFPCNIFNQDGSSGPTLGGYDSNRQCHVQSGTRRRFSEMLQPKGQVYFTWDDVKNPKRNLAVYESCVLPPSSF